MITCIKTLIFQDSPCFKYTILLALYCSKFLKFQYFHIPKSCQIVALIFGSENMVIPLGNGESEITLSDFQGSKFIAVKPAFIISYKPILPMKWLEEAQYYSDKGRTDLAESGQGIPSLSQLRGMRDPTPAPRAGSIMALGGCMLSYPKRSVTSYTCCMLSADMIHI